MMTIGEKLKQLREARGLSLRKLAQKAHLSHSFIKDIESGRSQPSIPSARALADALGVRPSALLNDINACDESNIQFCSDDVVWLPVVAEVQAGNPRKVIEQYAEKIPTESFWVRGGEFFWIRVQGRSMVGAGMEPGDLVLIRRQETVDNGDIAVVEVDEEGAMLKRVFVENGTIILASENPQFPPRTVSPDKVRIIGKAKRLDKEL